MRPQKPPDLDEKKKPIVSAKPPDIDVEPSLDTVLVEAKQSLAPSVNRFEKSVVNATPVSDDEPTTFAGGFLKSIKDQILENTVGNPMLQAAAQPRGVDRAETLANLSNLVLPTGIPPVIKTVKGMFAKIGKATEKVVKDTVKVAEKTLEKTPPLKVQSEVPKTSSPILDESGRPIAPAQELVNNPHPNYPQKTDDIFTRMGMGIEQADDAIREPLDFSKTGDRFLSDAERMRRERANRPRNISEEDYYDDWNKTQRNSARNEGRNVNDVNTPLTREQQIIKDSAQKIQAHSDEYARKFAEAEELLPEGEFYKPSTDIEAVYKAEQAAMKKAHQELVKKLAPLEKSRLPDIDVRDTTNKAKKLPYKTVNGKLYLKEVTKENIDQIYKGGYELAEDGSIVKAGVKAPVDSALPVFSGGRRGGKKAELKAINKETGEIADDAVLPEVQTAKPPNKPPDIPEELADDALPPDGIIPPKDESSIIQKGYDLFRGLKSTDLPFITSAAFRQGSTQVGTVPWLQAWGKAAKAYGSKAASEAMELARKENPLFADSVDEVTGKRIPSYAEQVGLREGSLKKYSKRDEQIRGELAEKIPLYGRHIASSNRAYNEFINHVMESKFTSMIDDAEKLAESARKTGKAKRGFFTSNISDADMLDPKKNLTLGKEIAEFVNTSLKRGKLGFEVGKHEGNLEKHSRALANVFFSPRNMASEVRMLNPSTYVMATPQVRYEYMMNMARRLSMWTSIAGLAKMGGAEVSLNPTNPDFGKLKFGDTRVDLPGGLQQFIVLANQIAAGGKTSSNSGKFNAFGTGNPYSGTEFSQMMEFGKNRLHPTVRYPIDFLSRTKKAPFRVGDRTFKMITPMFLDDMAEVGKNNPELMPIIGMITSAGIGTQTYEKGKFGKPTYPMLFPENRDFNIGRR